MRRKFLNKGQIAGIAVVVVSLSLIVFQAMQGESSVTFYTPAEVYAAPLKFADKTFRVSGLVLKNSKVWNKEEHHLNFRMTDMQGHDFNVQYKGVPPDLFKEGQGVVVEGKLVQNSDAKIADKTLNIAATLLMVKHSEVYDTKKDHSQMREVKLLDSMLKK